MNNHPPGSKDNKNASRHEADDTGLLDAMRHMSRINYNGSSRRISTARHTRDTHLHSMPSDTHISRRYFC